MKDRPRPKIVNVIPPGAIKDNAAWTANVVDTLGFRRCTFYCMFGAMDIAMVGLKLQESDVKASATALTGGADVAGTTFGTSLDKYTGAAAALPIDTDDNKIVAIDVPLQGRKRYLLPVATAGDGAAGTYMTCWAELDQAEEAPDNAAERGCSSVLQAA